jgi:hypothetical protein
MPGDVLDLATTAERGRSGWADVADLAASLGR